MYAKHIVVALLLGVLLMPASGHAGLVDHSSSNVVATQPGDTPGNGRMLLADGTVWNYHRQAGSPDYDQDPPEYEPPVPVAQIRIWSLESFVTMDGHVWTSTGFFAEWIDLGPVPIGPISTDQQGVGSMKSKFAPQQSNDQ